MSKPICSLSLDLDNEWSYLKTHGDQEWRSFPSYLDVVVPRVLDMLDQRGWKITFFIVGQDAALEKNHDALRMITAAGHEVGNHSFHHEPWLHTYSKDQTEEEIEIAEGAIEDATGARPRGFRGPGYSFSSTTLEVLGGHGYLYDASTLPTYLGPLARAYYFMTSDLSKDERDRRKELFGGFRNGLKPIRPYRIAIGDRNLLEIPVTTMPVCKLPFHFSYLLYISTYSSALARVYFKAALGLCRAFGSPPSLLLHPLDFLGREDRENLSFFPAMNVDSARKSAELGRLFDVLAARFSVISLDEHARRLDPDLENLELGVHEP